MSSFIHTPEVVSFIANVLADNCKYVFSEDGNVDAEKLAHDLMTVNTEAVNCRYRESSPVANFIFKRQSGLSLMQGFKYLQSFIYQICDCYDMDSPMGQKLQDAKCVLATKIISRLPEYDACKWS